MIENLNNSGPTTYEHWLDLGRVIIPCIKGLPIVKGWNKPDFKITKEEWKEKYSHCEIALRLDEDVDCDIDNELAKRFIEKYVSIHDSVSGRSSNPYSHYWWKGKLKFKQFSLPKEFEKNSNCQNLPHGLMLCEIRHGETRYTIVPGSQHSKANEVVKWERFGGFNEYPGDLNSDLRKVALSTALCILYAPQGQRDSYCTAIAGVLLKHTKWSAHEIDEFIYNLAIASNDNEKESRRSKGTTGKEAQKNLGLPKLAEIIGCSTKAIAELFSWVATEDSNLSNGTGKEVAEESIGEITEYGQDRYIVKINAVVQGVPTPKEIILDGPTLRNKKLFYDAVISMASVWIPEMPPKDFEVIMRQKYECRKKSEDYEDEADGQLVFKKYFMNYIKQTKAYTDKKELFHYGLPYFSKSKDSLEFNLDRFEDFLHSQKISFERVDLVLKLQRILKAKKNRGKYKEKSLVSWRIDKPQIDAKDITHEGEFTETTGEIDFEA